MDARCTFSDTCGLGDSPERYCIISSLDSHTYRDRGSNQVKEKCYNCHHADNETEHNVRHIIHKKECPEGQERDECPKREQKITWWQAGNGHENVSVQLDLEAEFHVTHIIITFKTFRPAAMYIEKSLDWGENWEIYRYFAYDCAKDFPGVHMGVPRSLSETVRTM